MGRSERVTYQGESALEQAVVDLVRVGATGFGPGVRQIANTLVRSVPNGVTDAQVFRAAVNGAIAEGTASAVGLRFAVGEIPRGDDGGHELLDVDPWPWVPQFVVEPRVLRSFEELVEERRRAEELAKRGVPLTRAVLMAGPPGVGKTLAARWIASQLELPLATVNLAAITSSYLGSSGRNLRSVLEFAKSGQCVLFLDEFDALAKRRDDESDMGELKRLVNVILVELDRWSGENLLVAATNHPHLLDPAVDRRFDARIDLGLPALVERSEILNGLATQSGVQHEVSDLVPLLSIGMDGYSGSDIERFWRACQRKGVLRGIELCRVLVEAALTELHSAGPERDRLWLHAHSDLGMSFRQIADRTGVSHPTVSSAIRRARKSGNE